MRASSSRSPESSPTGSAPVREILSPLYSGALCEAVIITAAE